MRSRPILRMVAPLVRRLAHDMLDWAEHAMLEAEAAPALPEPPYGLSGSPPSYEDFAEMDAALSGPRLQTAPDVSPRDAVPQDAVAQDAVAQDADAVAAARVETAPDVVPRDAQDAVARDASAWDDVAPTRFESAPDVARRNGGHAVARDDVALPQPDGDETTVYLPRLAPIRSNLRVQAPAGLPREAPGAEGRRDPGFVWGKFGADYSCSPEAPREQVEWVDSFLRPYAGAILDVLGGHPPAPRIGTRFLFLAQDGTLVRIVSAPSWKDASSRDADGFHITPLDREQLGRLDVVDRGLPRALRPRSMAPRWDDETAEAQPASPPNGWESIAEALREQDALVLPHQHLDEAPVRLAFLGRAAACLRAEDGPALILLDPPDRSITFPPGLRLLLVESRQIRAQTSAGGAAVATRPAGPPALASGPRRAVRRGGPWDGLPNLSVALLVTMLGFAGMLLYLTWDRPRLGEAAGGSATTAAVSSAPAAVPVAPFVPLVAPTAAPPAAPPGALPASEPRRPQVKKKARQDGRSSAVLMECPVLETIVEAPAEEGDVGAVEREICDLRWRITEQGRAVAVEIGDCGEAAAAAVRASLARMPDRPECANRTGQVGVVVRRKVMG